MYNIAWPKQVKNKKNCDLTYEQSIHQNCDLTYEHSIHQNCDLTC